MRRGKGDGREELTFGIPIHDYLKDILDGFLTILRCNENERHANEEEGKKTR
jgi:hypothetical protein